MTHFHLHAFTSALSIIGAMPGPYRGLCLASALGTGQARARVDDLVATVAWRQCRGKRVGSAAHGDARRQLRRLESVVSVLEVAPERHPLCPLAPCQVLLCH